MDENMNNVEPNKSNGLAIAGFVVSLVSIFFNFYCITGIVTGIVGIILSIIGLKKSSELGGKGKGMAIAGIVLGVVGIVIGIIVIVTIVSLFSNGANELIDAMNAINSL